MSSVWLLLHLVGVIVWIGGMFFALHCLRPAALALPPPQRVSLMLDALGRFFTYVIAALIVIWASGLALIGMTGMKGAPVGWHVMIAIAVVMTALFAVIRLVHYPRARRSLAGAEIPKAGAALERIRLLVMINLALGLVAIIAVKLLA